MALKDLASDLSNFKGQTSPKSIDNQIKKGVDFIPNDDASGFTPKTNLESLYKRVNSAVGASDFIPASDGVVGSKYPDAAPTNQITRKAYGEAGEYVVDGFNYLNAPFVLGGDSLGTPWSPDFPRVKGIDDYVSLIKTTGFENSKLSLISIPKLFTPQEFETVNLSGPKVPVSYEKQRGVFDSYPTLKFEYRDKETGTIGQSVHISPGGQIKAGSRYGAMTGKTFKGYELGQSLTDEKSAKWPDNVSSVDIFPIVGRTSQYGSSFESSTMSIPATETDPAFRQTAYTSRTVYGNTVSSLSDLFRSKEMWSTDNLNKIDELIKFEDGNFIGIPTGLDQNMRIGASTTDFRTVANTGPHEGIPNTNEHPLILRGIGTTWGSDDSLRFEQSIGSQFNASVLFGGEGSLNTLLERTAVDRERILKWQATTAGRIFIDKQYKLQFANPTIESKLYNLNSLTGIGVAEANFLNDNEGLFASVSNNPTLKDILGFSDTVKNVSVYHGQRHKELAVNFDIPPTFGIDIPPQTIGIPGRYESMVKLTDSKGRLHYQAKAFSAELSEFDLGINIPGNLLGNNFVSNFIKNTLDGAIDKIEDTISSVTAAPNILLSNPNRYLGMIVTTAPVSISNGIPSFAFNAFQVLFDTGKVINRKGSTFNRDSHTAAEKGDGAIKNESITHASFPYSSLSKTFSYESKLQTPTDIKEYDKRQHLNGFSRDEAPWVERIDKFEQRQTDKRIADAIGNPGQTGTHSQKHETLGMVKLTGGSFNSNQSDKINMIPYGRDYSDRGNIKDFIKFKFEDMVNNKFIIFRAILEGISDSVTPEYGEEKYIGRPDKVYVYQGTDRTVSFGFSIFPKTKQELPVLMEKLNYLVGLCYPSYTESERMVTPLMSLTLGDMFVEAPGLLTSLSVSVEDTSTWELDEGLQFPHFIKAQCEFKYIGSNKLASKGKHYGIPWLGGSDKFEGTQSDPQRRPFREEPWGKEKGFFDTIDKLPPEPTTQSPQDGTGAQ